MATRASSAGTHIRVGQAPGVSPTGAANKGAVTPRMATRAMSAGMATSVQVQSSKTAGATGQVKGVSPKQGASERMTRSATRSPGGAVSAGSSGQTQASKSPGQAGRVAAVGKGSPVGQTGQAWR